MRSALGKARGQALRLALVLEYLWWCAEDGMAPPPAEIGERAMAAAATVLADYFAPMAERGQENSLAPSTRFVAIVKPLGRDEVRIYKTRENHSR